MCTKETEVKFVGDPDLPPEFIKVDKPFGLDLHVFQILYLGIITHVFGLYYLFYLLPFGHVPKFSFLYWLTVSYIFAFGITVGAHRYWSHRSFKAKLPLEVLLMLLQTAVFQFPIYKWARDHRAHHKYTDTNRDPHNATRGFWFSHVFWLFKPKHRELVEALKTIDVSDLVRDPVVRFQCKYYWELLFVVNFAIPIYVGRLFFPEMSFFHLFCGNLARHLLLSNTTFTLNSVAHIWGYKPFDKNMSPADNKGITLLSVGEGCHNYHHTFPWDYSSPEFGMKLNLSILFIHFFAWIGWAYDLKTVSHKMIHDRVKRTGDGTHEMLYGKTETYEQKCTSSDGDHSTASCWGWGDDQISKQDLEVTETLFPSKNLR